MWTQRAPDRCVEQRRWVRFCGASGIGILYSAKNEMLCAARTDGARRMAALTPSDVTDPKHEATRKAASEDQILMRAMKKKTRS